MFRLGNKPTNVKAAIYTRVSTLAQKDGYGLEYQLEACKEKCRHKGFEIYDEYVDGAVSGTTEASDRTHLNRLLQDGKDGKFTVIVFYSFDRLARNHRILSNLCYDLDKQGISIISCREEIDTTTQQGKFMFNIYGSVSELEHETIITRLWNGRKRKKLDIGYCGGKLPYGYCMIDKKIHPDPDKTKIIKYIFAQKERKISMRAIANELNNKGIPSPLNKLWSGKGIKVIYNHEDKYKGGIINGNQNDIRWPILI